MSTLRFENRMQLPFRVVVSDCAEESGGGQDFSSATNNTSPIILPSGFFPYPSMQYSGYYDYVASGIYNQASAGQTQTFNLGLLVDGSVTGSFMQMFSGSPLADLGVGDGNVRWWSLECRMFFNSDLDDTSEQLLRATMTMFNASLGTLIGVDTKYQGFFIDPKVSHDIGFQIGKVNAAAFTTNLLKVRTITGSAPGGRSGS